MKSKFLVWSSGVAGAVSAVWVLLLGLLVTRCKLSVQPFPVLAKFSPFRSHLVATDRMLQISPILALVALLLVGTAWYAERSFQAVRPAIIVIGVSVLVSILVLALNAGGYLSWFFS